MSYSIHFLNDQDFEKLPAKDIESKIGVAYPHTGEAFVRSTGVNTLDVFTALHELEHLKGNDLDEHFDQENKCYYKGFSQALGPVGGVLGSMFGGPVGGILGSSMGGSMGGGSPMGSLFGNIFSSLGGGQKQQQQQAPTYNISYPSPQTTAAPATVQTAGAGGGVSQGGIGGNAVKNLQSQLQSQDIENQQYGTASGRSPLMSAFGGY